MDTQPIIAATLSNPLSAYLTRIQAHSKGVYTEMFIMDNKGLNVGQSSVTSDYWQGDEDKFKKSYGAGARSIFIDEAEFNDETGTWNAQISMAISNTEGEAIGAITVEVNLSELVRRRNLKEPKPVSAPAQAPVAVEPVVQPDNTNVVQ